MTAKLQSMFPQTSTSAITQAISNAQNLQGAIDCLLATNRRDISGIYHIKLFKVTLFQKYIVLIFQFLSTFLVPLRALHNFGNLYEYMSVIDLMNCKLNLFRGNNI